MPRGTAVGPASEGKLIYGLLRRKNAVFSYYADYGPLPKTWKSHRLLRLLNGFVKK